MYCSFKHLVTYLLHEMCSLTALFPPVHVDSISNKYHVLGKYSIWTAKQLPYVAKKLIFFSPILGTVMSVFPEQNSFVWAM